MPQFPFPRGTQNKLVTLHIKSLTDDLVKGAFEYISKHGFHYTPNNSKKHIVVPRGCAYSGKRTFSIEFESLFKKALDDGSDNMQHRDYYRYQTNPDNNSKLLECPEIKEIVNRVQVCINSQVSGYAANKISFLYSLPGGKSQGWHVDDARELGTIAKNGSLISVIVAFQNNTKLDVRNENYDRKTFIIPSQTMFVFDGQLVHSGSAYDTHNLRLHIYFMKLPENQDGPNDSNVDTNVIAHTYVCPVKSCPKFINKCSLTLSQMRNHWRINHSATENMGWKRYVANQSGNLHDCNQCGQSFLSLDGLKRHISKKHKLHQHKQSSTTSTRKRKRQT
jgi:hypothetical protein